MSCTKIKVKLPPEVLKSTTGASELEVEVCESPVTVMSLLKKLLEQWGGGLYNLLYDEETGEIRSGVLIVVNGRVVQRVSEVLEKPVEVTITIAYEGG